MRNIQDNKHIFIEMVIFISVSISKYVQYKKENNRLKLCLRNQEKYINTILKKNTMESGFRHDIRHHMNMLAEYIKNNDIKSAEEYILKINGVIECTKREVYTGIAAVDAIISEMCCNMDKNIDFKWSGIISNNKKTDVFDMCTLFANIMSNAIEACNKCTCKKYIKVKIYQFNDVIKICEENPHDGNIRTDRAGELITSKKYGSNHGWGIKNIKRVVKKYDGNIKTFYDERIFKIDITI